MSETLSLLAAFGLSFGLRYKLAPALRLRPGTWPARLLSCSYCTGIYGGAIAFCLRVASPPVSWPVLVATWPALATWAFASAAFCWALDEVVTWFERCKG